MGVLPLQFAGGTSAKTLSLDGSETYSILGLEDAVNKGGKARLVVTRRNGEKLESDLVVRLDSSVEREYYLSGGILDYVLQRKAKS